MGITQQTLCYIGVCWSILAIRWWNPCRAHTWQLHGSHAFAAFTHHCTILALHRKFSIACTLSAGWLPQPDGHQQQQATLLTLEQSLQPSIVPPKPLDGAVKGISARQVHYLLEDLRKEVLSYLFQAAHPLSCSPLELLTPTQSR